MLKDMLYISSMTENWSVTIIYMLFYNSPMPNIIHPSLQYVIKVVILSTCILKIFIAVFVSSHKLIQKQTFLVHNLCNFLWIHFFHNINGPFFIRYLLINHINQQIIFMCFKTTSKTKILRKQKVKYINHEKNYSIKFLLNCISLIPKMLKQLKAWLSVLSVLWY